MKKLIITIFIIFAYSTPQVFAVLPQMFRSARLIGGIRGYIDNYDLYVTTNPNLGLQIAWNVDNQIFRIHLTGGVRLQVNLEDVMKEAFDEWAPAFRTPVATMRSTTLRDATIRISTNQVANPCIADPTPLRLGENAVLTNYRGAFPYNPDYGSIVFYAQCFEQLLNDAAWTARFREIVGRNNISLQTIFNMVMKIKAKQAIGKIFGLGMTVVPDGLLPLNGFLTYEYEQDITNLQAPILVFRPPLGMDTTFEGQTEFVSIMMPDIERYLNYVRERTGVRRIDINNIRVSNRDIQAVVRTNSCFQHQQPQNPTQKEGSIIINCNFPEIKATITSYLANDTARTTAITSQK